MCLILGRRRKSGVYERKVRDAIRRGFLSSYIRPIATKNASANNTILKTIPEYSLRRK